MDKNDIKLLIEDRELTIENSDHTIRQAAYYESDVWAQRSDEAKAKMAQAKEEIIELKSLLATHEKYANELSKLKNDIEQEAFDRRYGG